MKTMTLLLSMATLALFVACKKKDSGGAPEVAGPALTGQACQVNVVPPTGYLCMNGILQPTGVVGSGNLLSNVQTQNSYFQGLISLSGTSTGSAMDLSNPRLISSYAGQVTVTGTLQVVNQALCGAPVGTYTVQGTGQIMYGALSNTTLSIVGPSNLQLMVASAQLYNNTGSGLTRDSNGNRLGIMQSQLVVNGQPCGSITSY